MRRRVDVQRPLMQGFIDHDHARELQAMGEVLEGIPEVLEAVREDLLQGRGARRGRRGMSADQVVRALVVKQMNGYSYEELAFHLADSTCYRAFCGIGAFEKSWKKSTLQENIKRLSVRTLEGLNQHIVRYAQGAGVETGKKARVDCTTVEATIHPPTDSTLLWDVTRVLVRLMKEAESFGLAFTNHERRAKRRAWGIRNAKRHDERVRLYRDLVKVTKKTVGQAEAVASALEAGKGSEDPAVAVALAKELRDVVGVGQQVIDQTRRRVFEGKTVPAQEKVVSLFERHTDIISTGSREPKYGHKVCLSLGASGLVMDCVVEEGNPADSTLATKMIQRHRDLYHDVPRQVVFDGGFASRVNLKGLKDLGVEDVAFSKRCGLAITEMVASSWVYKRLRNFRAGIEAYISFLKRCFGLSRCSWKGWASFGAYVWSSVVSVNLLIIARHKIATAT